jgi:hypothetical protein
MAKHRQNEKVIADAMTPGLGGVEQDGDFGLVVTFVPKVPI